MFLLRVRAIFEKTGRSKYISHLDLNRCMLRTFRRSGLPIWYTEGFNPHLYYAFALALSLGFESSCEIFGIIKNAAIASSRKATTAKSTEKMLASGLL